MKLNFKAVAAAAAMLAATAAHADFVSGATAGTTGNSTLGVLAWNTVTGAYYLRDTGFTLNTFLPSNGSTITPTGELTPVYDKTPSTGLTLTAGNTTSFADASFSTWLGGQTAADVRWTVVGADRLGTSTTNRFRQIGAINDDVAFATPSNGTIDGQTALINGLSGVFSLSTTGTLSTALLAGANGSFINQGSGGALSSSLDDDANLYYWTRTVGGGSLAATTANQIQYGNGAGFAKVTLESDGDFSYVLAPESVTAVPLPAAAWMLGAGLLSLGGTARRRKAASKAEA
jgi:hypothetical protein